MERNLIQSLFSKGEKSCTNVAALFEQIEPVLRWKQIVFAGVIVVVYFVGVFENVSYELIRPIRIHVNVVFGPYIYCTVNVFYRTILEIEKFLSESYQSVRNTVRGILASSRKINNLRRVRSTQYCANIRLNL